MLGRLVQNRRIFFKHVGDEKRFGKITVIVTLLNLFPGLNSVLVTL